MRAESSEYNARYVPRVPDDAAYAGRIGPYLGSVLPHYAASFMDWWRDRLRPEIERNFAYLDAFDMEGADLTALAVLFEDAIDVHDRHWKIHWMINFSQFSATLALNGAIAELGDVDPALPGRLQSSPRRPQLGLDRGALADEGGDQGRARAARGVHGETRRRRARALDGQRPWQPLPARAARPLSPEFGRKAVWSHEFIFPTWFEKPAPIIEAVRGYLETDYDYPSTLAAVRADLDAARSPSCWPRRPTTTPARGCRRPSTCRSA